ncbi:hypothetical protein [Alteriqipengyuania sp. 357]
MTDNVLEEINAKLDTLIRIQALVAVRDMDIQKDRIIYLSGADIRPNDIATILGTTSNTVNVAIAKHKKATAQKTKD